MDVQVLKEYLDNVQLGHILEREAGWDVVQDWMDVLSGGEKQRMAVSHLFTFVLSVINNTVIQRFTTSRGGVPFPSLDVT